MLCLLLTLICLCGMLVVPAFADDMPEDTTFYHAASCMSVYINKELNKSKTPGLINNHNSESCSGVFLGFSDPADSGESFIGQLVSKLTNSSQSYSYARLNEIQSQMMRYAQYGWLLGQMGFDKTGTANNMGDIVRLLGGILLVVVFALMVLVETMFRFVVWFLEMINPFAWFGKGIDSFFSLDTGETASLAGQLGTFERTGDKVADALSPIYDVLKTVYMKLSDLGLVIIAVFLIVMLFSIFALRRSAGTEIKHFVTRFLGMFLCVPICGSLYCMSLETLKDAYKPQNSTATRLVSSVLLDFESWARNARLSPVSGAWSGSNPIVFEVTYTGDESDPAGWAVSSKTQANLTQLALLVNSNCYYAANGVALSPISTGGITQNSVTDASSFFASGYNDVYGSSDFSESASENDQASKAYQLCLNMIIRYLNHSFYYPSTWETEVKANMDEAQRDKWAKMYTDCNKVGNIDESFGSGWAGTNADIWFNGDLGCGTSTAGVTQFAPVHATSYTGGDNPDTKVGLSSMALYNYLSTAFDDSGAEVFSNTLSASTFTRRSHYTVNVIGTGMLSVSYFVSVVVLLGCLSVLGIFYAIGVMFGGMRRTFDMITSIPMALLGSFNGMLRVITYTIMLICEVLVTLFMYNIFSSVFQFISTDLVTKLAETLNSSKTVTQGLTVLFGQNSPQAVAMDSRLGAFGVIVVQIVAVVFEIIMTKNALKYRKYFVRQMEEMASRFTQNTLQKLSGASLNNQLPSTQSEDERLSSPAGLARRVGDGLSKAANDAERLNKARDGGHDDDEDKDANAKATEAGAAALAVDEPDSTAELDGEEAAIAREMENEGKNIDNLDDPIGAGIGDGDGTYAGNGMDGGDGQTDVDDRDVVSDDDTVIVNNGDVEGAPVPGNGSGAGGEGIDDYGNGYDGNEDAVAAQGQAEALEARADAAREAGNEAAAGKDYEEAAKAREAAGDYEGAQADYEDAAEAYDAAGDAEAAARAYEAAAAKANRKDDAVRDSTAAAKAYEKTGNKDGAAKNYRDAAENFDNQAKAADARADAYEAAAASEPDSKRRAALREKAASERGAAQQMRANAADMHAKAAGNLSGEEKADEYKAAGKSAYEAGDNEAAEKAYNAAAVTYGNTGRYADAAQAHDNAAKAAAQRGDTASAMRHQDAAKGMRENARNVSVAADKASAEAASFDERARQAAENGNEVEAGYLRSEAARGYDNAAQGYKSAGMSEKAAEASSKAGDRYASAGNDKAAAGSYADAAKESARAGDHAGAAAASEKQASSLNAVAAGTTDQKEKAKAKEAEAKALANAGGSYRSAGMDRKSAEATAASAVAAADAAGTYAAAGDSKSAARMHGEASKAGKEAADSLNRQSASAAAAGDYGKAARLSADAATSANLAAASGEAAGDKNAAAGAYTSAASANRQSASMNTRQASAMNKQAAAHEKRAAELDKKADAISAKLQAAESVQATAPEGSPEYMSARSQAASLRSQLDLTRGQAKTEREAGAQARTAAQGYMSGAMQQTGAMQANSAKAAAMSDAGSGRELAAKTASMQAMKADVSLKRQESQAKFAEAGSYREEAASLRSQAERASGREKAELLEQAESAQQHADDCMREGQASIREAQQSYDRMTGAMSSSVSELLAQGKGSVAGAHGGRMFKQAVGQADSIAQGAKTPEAHAFAASAYSGAADVATASANAYGSSNHGGRAAMLDQSAAMYEKASAQSQAQGDAIGQRIVDMQAKGADKADVAKLENKQKACYDQAKSYAASASNARSGAMDARKKAEMAASSAKQAYAEATNNQGNPMACGMASERAAASFGQAGDLKKSAMMYQKAGISYTKMADSSGSRSDYARAAEAMQKSSAQYEAMGNTEMARQMSSRAAEMWGKAGKRDQANSLRDRAIDMAASRRAMTETGQAVSRMDSLGGGKPSAVAQPMTREQLSAAGVTVSAGSDGVTVAVGGVNKETIRPNPGGAARAPQSAGQNVGQAPAQAYRGTGAHGGTVGISRAQAKSDAYKSAASVRDTSAVFGAAGASGAGGTITIRTSKGTAKIPVGDAVGMRRAMASVPADLVGKAGDVVSSQYAYSQARTPKAMRDAAEAYEKGLKSMGYSPKLAGMMRDRMELAKRMEGASAANKRSMRAQLAELDARVAERTEYEMSSDYAEGQRKEANRERDDAARKKANRLRAAAGLFRHIAQQTSYSSITRPGMMGTPNEITRGGGYGYGYGGYGPRYSGGQAPPGAGFGDPTYEAHRRPPRSDSGQDDLAGQ